MHKYDLSKILNRKSVRDISNEEWKYLNSLDFDLLFEDNDKPKNNSFVHALLLGDIVSGFNYLAISKLNFIYSTYDRSSTISDKGWSLIKWSILNRFNNTCKVVDELLDSLNYVSLGREQTIIKIISMVPVDNYGIMISLLKNPDKLIQLIN